jgi:alginate O-acetyltransferase complex protein AlgI
MTVVVVGWVFFRAETLTDALHYLQAMVGLGGRDRAPLTILAMHFSPDVQLALLAGVASSFPWLKDLGTRLDSMPLSDLKRALLDNTINAGLLLMFVVALTQLAAGTYNPFIYFRF